jgi:hypothetical protein
MRRQAIDPSGASGCRQPPQPPHSGGVGSTYLEGSCPAPGPRRPLPPRRRRAAPRRNRGEQAAAVEVVLVPQPCHKHRSSPVVSGQQGSLVLRHESSADALLSWTNGHMSWSVRGAGDGNRTRMASLASWFYGALLTTEASPAVSAGGRCLRGRLRSSRRTPGEGPRVVVSVGIGLPVKIAMRKPPTPSAWSDHCRDLLWRSAGRRQVVSGQGGTHSGGGRHRRRSPCGCRRRCGR